MPSEPLEMVLVQNEVALRNKISNCFLLARRRLALKQGVGIYRGALPPMFIRIQAKDGEV